ncbi:DUF6346 domain-containing protein [Solwaraspora sp. WMMD937]|uniref:DUF6346 domain-containing protein n=1 Tax=Solwaraspora sp. WMMD937 TaxID=3016090 RepID=UPI00249A5C93|nr:DUF6346 domain-containing protein [Solwaraspora sp. WMMD937]WFE20716.1 DUF6346 domain-containing protein [Solwaraspora sp. WMMD937]
MAVAEIRVINRIAGVLKYLAASVLIAVVAAAIALGIRSVESSYSGTGLGISMNHETGFATPNNCRRIGPVSEHGFGYWWSCSAQVEMDDGRVLEIETEASMLRPGERDVAIVESCQKNRPTKCVYSQPGNFVLALGVRLLGIITAAVAISGAGAAAIVAVFALIGGWRVRVRVNGEAEAG